MTLPEIHRNFSFNGTRHDRESLPAWCRQLLEQPGEPEWKKAVGRFLLEWLDPSLEAMEQYTSGTTGPPARILLDREAMTRSARMTLSHFGLKPGDRALLCLPVRYIAGKMMVVRALVGGLDLVAVRPEGNPLEGLGGPVAFGAMVPLQVHDVLKAGGDLSLVSRLLIGGGEIHPSLREELAAMDRPALYESFAMTETYTHVALRRINGPERERSFRLLKGVSAKQDARGCLVVEVEGVTPGPVVTSDLVEFTADGKGFVWQGRVDHLISTGGIKVIPEALEQRIGSLLGVACLVLPEPDRKLGQRLVLVAESRLKNPPVARWMARMKESLPGYEVPKRIVVIPALPRNASFKPDRLTAREFL